MKYKVGDRVKYGSEICTITKVLESQGKFKYRVQSDTWFDIVNEDEMIEGLVEEETKPKYEGKMNELRKMCTISLNNSNYSDKIEVLINDYEYVEEDGKVYFVKKKKEHLKTYEGCCCLELKYDKLTIADNICTDKVEIVLQDYELEQEDGKWFAVKKKKEYPKTYEECCGVLGVSEFEYNHTATNVWYRHKLMATLDNLMLCRDAYWKLYGEQMGLGKPWEPDWDNKEESKYVLYNYGRGIGETIICGGHQILAFPTKEMRDAFYENFKELIEICKELL